jgi:hypothetical protein
MWISEGGGIVEVVEGETNTYSIEWKRATSVSSATTLIQKGTTDVTATLSPSGTITYAGNIVTLKPITFPVDGGTDNYVLAVTATVDGQVKVAKAQFQVSKKSAVR